MIDALVAILAAITGTDDGGIEHHSLPECFDADEYSVVECYSPDSPNPYMINADGTVVLIHNV